MVNAVREQEKHQPNVDCILYNNILKTFSTVKCELSYRLTLISDHTTIYIYFQSKSNDMKRNQNYSLLLVFCFRAVFFVFIVPFTILQFRQCIQQKLTMAWQTEFVQLFGLRCPLFSMCIVAYTEEEGEKE